MLRETDAGMAREINENNSQADLENQEYLVVSMFRRLDHPKKQFTQRTFEANAGKSS